jgi:hypothetical protein
MKRLFLILIPLLLVSCTTTSIPKRNVKDLAQTEEVYEVIGHLYRWYLDEVDIRKGTQAGNNVIWVREIKPRLDPGDKSRFAELILPIVGVRATLKKTDYTIEELDMKIASDNFKITRVARINLPSNLKEIYTPVEINRDELRQYLFNKRNESTFPDKKLIERLRTAVRNQVREHMKESGKKMPDTTQTIHFSSLSPVANELWVFWEGGRMLIKFSSDLGIDNPYVWEHDELSAEIYDIDEQVVVSMQEVLGSNAYLTRDQVGRALYNCIVLGKSVELKPVK